jgi:hypothetical protein
MLQTITLENAFAKVPADVWRAAFLRCRWQHANMLRRVCKSMQHTVDAMLLPAAVRMCPLYFYKDQGAYAMNATRFAFILQRLVAVAMRSTVTTLALLSYEPRVYGLRTVLELCPHLQRLEVASRDSLGAVGTAIIVQGLRHCTALARLQLSRNDIRLQGMHALVPVLAANRGLCHLDLSANNLQDSGVEVLARVLALCTALAHLNLSRNRLQGGAARTLHLALPSCSALADLDVAENQLKNHGAALLAAALPRCNIQSLDISNNRCACSLPCWHVPAVLARSLAKLTDATTSTTSQTSSPRAGSRASTPRPTCSPSTASSTSPRCSAPARACAASASTSASARPSQTASPPVSAGTLNRFSAEQIFAALH